MEEPVPCRHGSIRPGDRAAPAYHLSAPRQGVIVGFDLFHPTLDPGRYHGSGEFYPGHTGRFQQLLIHRWQLLHLTIEELPQTFRHLPHRSVHPSHQFPAHGALSYHALADQFVHHSDQKQRVASGALLQ